MIEGRLAGQTKTYPPTREMQMAAREGLNLQQKYDRGESKNRLEIAEDIAMGRPLDRSDWRSIASHQARYYGNQEPQPSTAIQYEDGGPDARYIAALLLGGRAGQEKAFDVVPEYMAGV